MAPLTLANAARPDELTGPSASAPVWSPDSSLLAYTNAGTLWLVGSSHDSTAVKVFDEVREFLWLPDGSALLALCGDGYVRLCWNTTKTGAAGAAAVLVALDADASALGTSPDGSVLSFIVGGDLWLCPLASSGAGNLSAGTPQKVTDVGVPPIAAVQLGTYYGVDRGLGPTPWGSAAPAYEWSADGAWICAHYVDRSNVRKVPFPYYLGDETMSNIHRRAYPGEDSEIRALALIEVAHDWTGCSVLLPLDRIAH